MQHCLEAQNARCNQQVHSYGGDRSLLAAEEGGSSESSEDGESGDEPGEATGQRLNGITVKCKRRKDSSRWKPELMRRLVKRETERLMKIKFGMSKWRQVAPAIPRKYLRRTFQSEPQPGRPELSPEDEYEHEYEAGVIKDSPWDGQGGHRSFTAGMVYGRLISEAEYEFMDIRAQFRAVSEEWHRFLHLASSIGEVGPPASQPRRNALSYGERASLETSLERWQRLADADIRSRLKALVGEGAEFRSVQEPSLQAIMLRVNPLLVVMGTSAGKSLCFMLPASSSLGGVTIVIVPLTSLQGDLQVRCEKSGISSIIWNSRRPHDTAPLIFVTPESALTQGFGGLLTRLVAAHQLERIVVDECHVVLDGKKDFRPKLRELGELALRGVQMVYLTATLPPRDEGEFFKLMHIDEANIKQFRGPTIRKNVKYQVIDLDLPMPTYDALGHIKEDSLEAAVQELVERKLREYPTPAKIIVYSGTIDAAKRLANAMGCSVFYSDVDTRDGKLQLLLDWINGRGPGRSDLGRRAIVSSNALGLGIDVPDIRVVIHFGWLRRLKNYGQESGRAGRDGQPSEAIIVRRRTNMRRAASTVDVNSPQLVVTSQFPDIDEFTGGQFCRRKILDLVMDGRPDRAGCEDGEERCDVCERWDVLPSAGDDAPAMATAAKLADDEARLYHYQLGTRIGRRRADVIENIERLRDFVEIWLGRCMMCFWLGLESESHAIWECTAENVDAALHGMWTLPLELRKWRIAGEVTGCLDCFLPQAMCKKWRSRGDVGGWERSQDDSECQFQDVIIGAFACLGWYTKKR